MVVSESSDFLHGNSSLPESKQKLPVLLKGTRGPGIVSLLPYFVGQSSPRPAQVQGWGGTAFPPDGKNGKQSTAFFHLPHDSVHIPGLMGRLSELIHKMLNK